MLCAVFRRGERGFASWDGLTGTVLTRCLQCSAQCFAGASRYVLAGCASGDAFLTQGLQCSAQGFAGASGGVASGDVFLKLLD